MSHLRHSIYHFQYVNVGSDRTRSAIPVDAPLRSTAMLQAGIDDMAACLFRVDEEPPAVVKWLFDVLDEQAEREGMDQPDILHAWKANWSVTVRLSRLWERWHLL